MRLRLAACGLILLLMLAAMWSPAHATITSNQADAVWGQPDFRADLCEPLWV